MKKKLSDIGGFIVFVLFTLAILPILMIYGAIITPFRYINYVKNKVKDLPVKEYYY